MVLDPIPQSLPVHFFGSRPQPPTSRYVTVIVPKMRSLRLCSSLSEGSELAEVRRLVSVNVLENLVHGMTSMGWLRLVGSLKL